MQLKKLICLLLALILTALCFAGCRGKKEEEPVAEPPAQVEPAETEEPEEPAEPEPEPEEEPEEETQAESPQIEVVDELTDVPEAIDSGDELVIVVPEGSEVGGD